MGRNDSFDDHSAPEALTHRSSSLRVRVVVADAVGGTPALHRAEMNPLVANASGNGREERLRLLALSTAILGLVLAPLGLSG